MSCAHIANRQLSRIIGAKKPRRIRLLPYDAPDPTKIPRRDWLYGYHYMRRIVSATIGPGGIGKSSLGLVEAVGMALGRDLLGAEALKQASARLVSQRRGPARRNQPPHRRHLHQSWVGRTGGPHEPIHHLRPRHADQGGAWRHRGETR